MPYCSNCGKEVKEDMNYCPSCGNKLAFPKATPTEILKAYIEFVKQGHLNVNPDPEVLEKLKKINEAYGMILDLSRPSEVIETAEEAAVPEIPSKTVNETHARKLPREITKRELAKQETQREAEETEEVTLEAIEQAKIEAEEQAKEEAREAKRAKLLAKMLAKREAKDAKKASENPWGLAPTSWKELRDSFVEVWEILIGKRKMW